MTPLDALGVIGKIAGLAIVTVFLILYFSIGDDDSL